MAFNNKIVPALSYIECGQAPQLDILQSSPRIRCNISPLCTRYSRNTTMTSTDPATTVRHFNHTVFMTSETKPL